MKKLVQIMMWLPVVAITFMACQTKEEEPKEEIATYDDLILKKEKLGIKKVYQYRMDSSYTIIDSTIYIFDQNQNITSIISSEGTTNFTYNEKNWLSTITYPNKHVTNYYVYDDKGNMVQMYGINALTNDTTSIHKYDYEGNSITEYYSLNNKNYKTVYTFTNKLLTKYVSYVENIHSGEYTTPSCVYTFSWRNGNRVGIDEINPSDGSIKQTNKFEYDNKVNIGKLLHLPEASADLSYAGYSSKNNCINADLTHYEYDEYGLPTKISLGTYYHYLYKYER